MMETDPERITNEFDFENLLEPYREGGTEDQPVRRTMGTIVDYLRNKKGYPVEIIGSGLLVIFLQLYNGRQYKGDGSYGSKGRELVTAIRMECDRLNQNKISQDMYQWMGENVFQYIARQAALEVQPWYSKIFRKKK